MTREEQDSIRHEIDLIIRMIKCMQVKNPLDMATKERIIIRLEVLKARIM